MIFDLHNDFLLNLSQLKLQQYIKDITQNNVNVCSAVWATELKNPIKILKNKQKIIKNYKNLRFSIEDLWFLNKNNINQVLNLNPTYCGLCWNKTNKLCGGAYDSGRITKFGKYVISMLEQNNIIVDTAHMNRRSFYDFASLTSKPIFCSHTGFCKIVSDRRNLTKKQLDILTTSGGLVGLYFVGKYISKQKVKTGDIVKNIDYFVNNYGTKNLAIGTDFYGSTDLPDLNQNYSDFLKIKKQLTNFGYKNQDIDAIFFKNAKNFF